MTDRTAKRGLPTVECRVPPALHRALKLLAAREARPMSDIVEDALEAYLPEPVKAEGRELARAAG